MKSIYIYSIAIVVVLLVLLFIYHVMNATPVANPSGNGDPGTVPKNVTTVTTTYIPVTATNISNILVSVNNSINKPTTVNNIIELNLSSIPVFSFSSGTTSVLNISAIQYDSSNENLNFFETSDPSSSKMSIPNPLSCIVGIVDSDNTASSPTLYDTSTASIVGNVLTLTSGTNNLIITFNVPITNPTTIITTYTPTQLSGVGTILVSVINSTTVNNTITIGLPSIPVFNFTSGTTSPFNISAIQYDKTNNLLNFFGTSYLSSTKMTIGNPLSCINSIVDTYTSYSGSILYDTSTASIVGNVLTLTSDNSSLTITFALPIPTTTITTTYTPTQQSGVGTILVSVINSTTVNNTITIGLPSIPGFNFSSGTTSPFNIGTIQYDKTNNLLNFFGTSLSSIKMTIGNPLSCINSIVDTSYSGSILYDTSTASIVGNVLTLTSDNSSLTITFALPNTNPTTITTTYTPTTSSNIGTILVTVSNLTTVTNTIALDFSSIPNFSSSSAFNVDTIQYDKVNNCLNFSELSGSFQTMSVPNPLASIASIVDSNTTSTLISYNVLTASITNNVLTLISNTNKLTITFNTIYPTTIITTYKPSYNIILLSVPGTAINGIGIVLRVAYSISFSASFTTSGTLSPLPIVSLYYNITSDTLYFYTSVASLYMYIQKFSACVTSISDSCTSTCANYPITYNTSTTITSVVNAKNVLTLTSGSNNLIITLY